MPSATTNVAVLATLGVVFALVADLVPYPLPHPAQHHTVEDVPPSLLPITAAPMTGDFASNTKLQTTQHVLRGRVTGSETVAVGHDGKTVYMADQWNRIHRGTLVEGSKMGALDIALDRPDSVYADLGAGRTLGLQVDKQGNLILCDCLKGLLMIEKGSRKTVLLATSVSNDSALDPGSRLHFLDDLDIADDGTIYFTDSTDLSVSMAEDLHYNTMRSYLFDLLRGKPSGRLCAYYPPTGKVHVLAKGLWFANGVAVAPDQSFVAVAETTTLSVKRHWLTGPKAGKTEAFIDKFPGYPDGINRSEDGNFWIALVASIHPIMKVLPYKFVRFVAAWVPDPLKPKAAKWSGIVKVTPEGKVIESFFDEYGVTISGLSAVTEKNGLLFLGTLFDDSISIFNPNQGKPTGAE